MTKPLVLKACYANWKPVPTRNTLQLIFELPLEQTQEAMRILGVPTSQETLWCAIARLVENGPDCASERTEAAPVDATTTPEASPEGQARAALPIKQGKRFSEMPRSQQAALKLQDNAFCSWLYGKYRTDVTRLMEEGRIIEGGLYIEHSDTVLKVVLNIISKTDLDKFPEAGANWDKLLASFETETRYGVS